jgi:hypothetical protein
VNRRLGSIFDVIWIGFVLLLSGCGALGLPAWARQPLDLTILHSGQVYGEIAPCG